MKRILLIFLLLSTFCYAAGPVKTTVTDTIYDQQGNLVNGSVQITNQYTFTSADGFPVMQGLVATVPITNGNFSVALVPNVNSTPVGSSYLINFKFPGVPPDMETEYWIVPILGPVNLLAVRANYAPPFPPPMIPFPQMTPPVNCISLGGIPLDTSVGWTCTGASGLQPGKPLGFSITFINPLLTLSGTAQYRFPGNGATLLSLTCDVDVGSAVINFDLRSASAPNTPTTNYVTLPSLTCPPQGFTQTISFPAGANIPIALDFISLTNNPGVLHVSGQYQLR